MSADKGKQYVMRNQQNFNFLLNPTAQPAKKLDNAPLLPSASTRFVYDAAFDNDEEKVTSSENVFTSELNSIKEKTPEKSLSPDMKKLSLSESDYAKVYAGSDCIEQENVFQERLSETVAANTSPAETPLRPSASQYVESGDVFENKDAVSGSKNGNTTRTSAPSGKAPTKGKGMAQFVDIDADDMMANKTPEWLELLRRRVADRVAQGKKELDMDQLMKEEEEMMYNELRVTRRVEMLNKKTAAAKPIFPTNFHATAANYKHGHSGASSVASSAPPSERNSLA